MSRILPFLLFLAIALSLIGGMHYYVWARLVRDPHLPPLAARVATVFIVGLGVSMPLSLIASRIFSPAPLRPAIWVAFVWMGVGFLFVAILGIADAGRLVGTLVQRLRDPTPIDPAKRLFLARTLAVGVGGVVAGLSAVGLRGALGAVQVK
jgi:hypothetical protein